MKKIRVGVVGYRGNIGGTLIGILNRHPYAEIVYTDSLTTGKLGNLAETEFIFLALPDGESEEYLSQLRGRKVKVIDHSLDNRGQWIYGLPEIFRGEILGASEVAMPGCWPTAIILGLYPLKGRVKWATVSGISGISGTGEKKVSQEDNIIKYKEGRKHPHIPEIERAVGFNNLIFSPAVDENTFRGLVTTVTALTDFCPDDFTQFYTKAYAECPFIRIIGEGTNIETRRVNNTNYCDIKITPFVGGCLITSALDNLVKGGAGQAVQNFNLMCGFEETAGLI